MKSICKMISNLPWPDSQPHHTYPSQHIPADVLFDGQWKPHRDSEYHNLLRFIKSESWILEYLLTNCLRYQIHFTWPVLSLDPHPTVCLCTTHVCSESQTDKFLRCISTRANGDLGGGGYDQHKRWRCCGNIRNTLTSHPPGLQFWSVVWLTLTLVCVWTAANCSGSCAHIWCTFIHHPLTKVSPHRSHFLLKLNICDFLDQKFSLISMHCYIDRIASQISPADGCLHQIMW